MELNILIKFLIILTIGIFVNCNDYSLISIEELNEYNERTLISNLKMGPKQFCKSMVDDAVIDCFGEGDVSRMQLTIFGKHENFTCLLRDMSEICEQTHNYDKHKETLIIVTGFTSTDTYNIQNKLNDIKYCTDKYNIIHIDAAITIEMMYKLIKFNTNMISYYVLKLIHTLMRHGTSYKNITLVGFSVGAEVIAHTAKLFFIQNHKKILLRKMYAIDPMFNCGKSDLYLHKDIAEQIIVIHGNNKFYGINESIGTIDFYPNGECQIQPGCKSNLCSHMFSLWLFIESICYPENILAQKCDNWNDFMNGKCHKNDVIGINMNIPENITGKFYCKTSKEVPFGLHEKGIYIKNVSTQDRTKKTHN